MSEWLPISKLFNFEKGSLQSSKCTAGDFTFITASADWKTHEAYTHDTEALVFAMAASGSLGRTHYVNGKFIASDLCFILTPKTDKKIDLAFYFRVFNFIREDIVKKTATGTSKLAINQSNFGNYKLPYFDFEHQVLFREKIDKISAIKNALSDGFDTQQTYLTQLRQAILQEAIEGKLTADWRAKNPVQQGDPNFDAQVLLETIKAEKQKLIADGKIKKTKKQESIVEHSLISRIPKHWNYVYLDDITLQITDGTHQTPIYTNEGRIFLSAQNVKPFKFMPENHKFVSEEAYQSYVNSAKAEKGDLLIGRVGAGIGETAVIDQKMEFAIYVSLGLIKPFNILNSNYLCLVFNSPYGVRYAKGNVSSSGGSAGNFNLGRIRSFFIPLPSIAEQNAIVERVDRLLESVNELEKQVNERKDYAEKLMQAVLTEAFEN